jgi:hypothetical protein
MRLAALFLGLISCGGAFAQPVSDIELRAAYCLGVSTAQIASDQAKYAATRDAAAKGLLLQIEAIIAERQKRFRDYLTAKGFIGDRNPENLRIALTRGSEDAPMCERELETPYYKACSDHCNATYAGNYDLLMACTGKCPSPESCGRVQKCLENFLPF